MVAKIAFKRAMRVSDLIDHRRSTQYTVQSYAELLSSRWGPKRVSTNARAPADVGLMSDNVDSSDLKFAAKCESAVREAGLRVVARVQETPSVIDLAVTHGRAQIIVRCVEHVSSLDYRALGTMLAEGDFTRAAIVYTAEDQPHLSGEIETYPLSRIDELAASLARESEP